MGNSCFKEQGEEQEWEGRFRTYDRPRWKAEGSLSIEELERMRVQFWDTEPHYGGKREIWDALQAVCNSDMDTSRLIIDSAGIVVGAKDMTVMYDEKGNKYELPKYVLSDPVNLKASKSGGVGPVQNGRVYPSTTEDQPKIDAMHEEAPQQLEMVQ